MENIENPADGAGSEHSLVIIDADSIIYIIGSSLQDLQLEPMGIIKLDEFLQDILINTGAKKYLGYFGGKGARCFRYDVAVTKPYKGTRKKEKEQWFDFWAPVLTAHMETVWGFTPVTKIEADDACTIAATALKGKYDKITIASPDKDLRQCGGFTFFDYGKRFTEFIDEVEGSRKLMYQLVTGRMLPV